MNLIKAIEAAASYASAEGDEGVILVNARSMDFADRWFRVEGVRKAFRRVYVVDMHANHVVEVLGGHAMEENDLINYAIRNGGK